MDRDNDADLTIDSLVVYAERFLRLREEATLGSDIRELEMTGLIVSLLSRHCDPREKMERLHQAGLMDIFIYYPCPLHKNDDVTCCECSAEPDTADVWTRHVPWCWSNEVVAHSADCWWLEEAVAVRARVAPADARET